MRRVTAVLVLLAVVAAACTDDDDKRATELPDGQLLRNGEPYRPERYMVIGIT